MTGRADAQTTPDAREKLGTVGEQLLGRALAKELRAGVEHYAPGQMEAVIYPGIEYGSERPVQIGRVTYVDAMGHACVVLTYRYLDQPCEWYATWVGRAGHTWKSQARKVGPGEFPLSKKMRAALAAAPVIDDVGASSGASGGGPAAGEPQP